MLSDEINKISSGIDAGTVNALKELVKPTELNDDDMTTYPKPKSGCRRCHGTGRMGFNFYSGEPIICTCILNNLTNKSNTNFMSWKEFKDLTTSKVNPLGRKTRHLTPKILRRSYGKKVGKYAKLDVEASKTVHQEEN